VDRDSKKVTLHPIDQDYTYSQLPEEDETESNYTRQALERRAGDYYAQLRTPEEKWESIEDLEPQLNEFEHLVLAGDYDDAGALLETIDDDYLRWWGHYARLVGMREKLQGNLTDGNLQVDNWASLGHAYSSLGQLNRAVGFFKNALTIAREIGNRQEEGVQLGNLGFAYRGLGYFEQAVECHEEAVAIACEISDRKRESRWLSDQGLAYNSLGEIERSIQLYRESLEIAREIGDHWWETVNIGRLGLAYHGLGQIEERAIPHYVRFLAFAREVGNRREEGVGLGWLGIAFYDLGRVERAVRLHQEALDIACEYNIRYYESIWSSYLGLDYSALGESEQALQFYERALAVAEEVGARRCESHHRVRLARTLISTGRFSEARQECAEALALSVPQTIYRAALLLGIVLLHLNDPAVEVAFADTVDHCSFMLEKTSNLYNARYVLATAFLGQAICDPRWTDEATRPELLTPALEEYRRALEITAAPGVVQDAVRDLELIQAAGIKGLEPVFKLLENVEYEPDESPPDMLKDLETEGNR
jgi:tetratricopeptide (TPR) repeat protein